MNSQDYAFFNELPGVDLLARLVWGEARGEERIGRVAVAWVVVNRVASGRYGDGLHGVILKPYQFSCFNPGDPNFPRLREGCESDPAYSSCDQVAAEVLSNRIDDPTGGATHYHTERVTPLWARRMKLCRQIGHHLFYREVI